MNRRGFAAVLTGVVLALRRRWGAAQEATPASDLPEAPAPGGLGRVALPSDEAGIAALFGRLPGVVTGQGRIGEDAGSPDDGRFLVSYGQLVPGIGPSLALTVQNVATGEFFPVGFTAGAFVALVQDVPDYDAEAFGREGDLVWIRAATTIGTAGDQPGTPDVTAPLYTLAWGNADSPWLFGATSLTREGLDALVAAFVSAAEAGPGTPEAGTPAALPATPVTAAIRPVSIRRG